MLRDEILWTEVSVTRELRKFHEIFVYSIGATFSNKTNLVTSGMALFTIFEMAKTRSNLGLGIRSQNSELKKDYTSTFSRIRRRDGASKIV